MNRINRLTAQLPKDAKTFLAWMEFQKGASEATIEAYAQDILDFEEYLQEWGGSLERPADISTATIQGFPAHLYNKKIARDFCGL